MSTLVVAAAVLTIPYWLGPLLIYATHRAQLGMNIVGAPPGTEPVGSSEHARAIREAISKLGECGFVVSSWFTSEHGASTVGVLLEQAEHGTLATVASMRVPNLAPVQMTIFESEYDDGRRVLTSNSRMVRSYGAVPLDDGMALPSVRDVALLYRAHRYRVAHVRSDAAPRSLTRGADAIEAERERQAENLRQQVATGYFTRGGVDSMRPTAKGALLMTWKLLPPFKQIAMRRIAHRERALLHAIGCDA